MNLNEAINFLRGYLDEEVYNSKCTEAHRAAIKALEKAIPKKPHEGHYEEQGENPYIKYSCPNGCKLILYRSNKSYGHNYCPKCGQAIDWRDDE